MTSKFGLFTITILPVTKRSLSKPVILLYCVPTIYKEPLIPNKFGKISMASLFGVGNTCKIPTLAVEGVTGSPIMRSPLIKLICDTAANSVQSRIQILVGGYALGQRSAFLMQSKKLTPSSGPFRLSFETGNSVSFPEPGIIVIPNGKLSVLK
ncbi:putative ORFan [Tupanvirus deep ocean]|uniref:ORFan n=2 Tax=Tupanvirus TaxID=2094720 RepID=A0AC62A730_9VIRU|nr:putative ORFan [Tupanvirus deep ocean]QKU33590.1 putative ORFan [Tupanvirus deep ocean]